jgi:hypothetical protein
MSETLSYINTWDQAKSTRANKKNEIKIFLKHAHAWSWDRIRAMDEVRKPSNFVCYLPSSEPYRIYMMMEIEEYVVRVVLPVVWLWLINADWLIYGTRQNQGGFHELILNVLIRSYWRVSHNYVGIVNVFLKYIQCLPQTKETMSCIGRLEANMENPERRTKNMIRSNRYREYKCWRITQRFNGSTTRCTYLETRNI